jgi:transcriptional regulator with XRE-family HTH domain
LQPLDAERVKEWRNRRMLSQQEVADRAGTSLFTIQRIERGEGNVRPKTGRGVAAALGVPIEELLPKAQAPLFRELPEKQLVEERLAGWEAAVEEARRLREGGRAQLAELLACHAASRARGELRSARRRYLDEIVQLFNKAYGATHRLADLLFAEGGIPAPDDWEEVRAADRFYWTLIEMMRNAGFQIRERKSEPPEVEEPDAA